MGLIQKLLDAGIMKRISRCRRRMMGLGNVSVPSVAGVEIKSEEEGFVDFVQPVSIVRITLDIDIADSDLLQSDERQLEILHMRLEGELDAQLARLTGYWK